MPIQEAWPTATATQRECLVSHLCPDCQDDIFGGDGDGDGE